MRIDSVSQSPDRAGRYLVKLSDGSAMKLYRQTVEDFRLYSGVEIEDLDAVREHNSRYSAKMRAVRIISASSVSKRDLENRLVRKGESEEQAKEAVQWLSELHLVDDRQTARQTVDSCIRKGYGIARAKQALYEKQIPKNLWEEALEDYPDQTERIADFLRSKLRDPDDPREVRRAIDAALRRGHSYGDVKRALEMIGTESEFEEEY
ncbi:MAG: regulatory protein RecX [Oscillospiraceae bacterium]|nr:regulatory protein RecX [Oscillospiraceae bacterium]